MSKLAFLRAASDLSDVANLLAIAPKDLSFVLYMLPAAARYETFDVPKRCGGKRTINAPTGRLKTLQKTLSEYLQDCVEELEAARLRKRGAAYGFVRDRTIICNASQHRNRRFVFNLDLLDFFPSINFGRVRGLFIKDKGFSLHPSVATVLAQIACYNNTLPQGSPCSPVISNLIAHILDLHLIRLATQHGCRYTRYADDLTFSTNKPTFPVEIAEPVSATAWGPGKALAAIVTKGGFSVHPTKTRLQFYDSRQEVTGLVVNRKVNARGNYRRVLRSMTSRLVQKGEFEFICKSTDALGNPLITAIPGNRFRLQGMFAFVDRIDTRNMEDAISRLDPKRHDAEIKYERVKLTRKENTYRRFLMFHEFFAAPRPVVLCEGPTDRIYLRCAVKSLAAGLPALATIDASGNVELSFRRYKYEKKNTNRILRIYGGADQLLTFIREYRDTAVKFTAPGPYEPVIILVDNDTGPKGLFDYLTKVNGVRSPRTEPFIHVCANVYVVPTPLTPTGGMTCIEDLFPSKLFATEIDGKTYDPKTKNGGDKHYGKTVFADKVVAPQAGSIDFNAFTPLLKNIELAVTTHHKNHPKP